MTPRRRGEPRGPVLAELRRLGGSSPAGRVGPVRSGHSFEWTGSARGASHTSLRTKVIKPESTTRVTPGAVTRSVGSDGAARRPPVAPSTLFIIQTRASVMRGASRSTGEPPESHLALHRPAATRCSRPARLSSRCRTFFFSIPRAKVFSVFIFFSPLHCVW